jgi:hypothetical protein
MRFDLATLYTQTGFPTPIESFAFCKGQRDAQLIVAGTTKNHISIGTEIQMCAQFSTRMTIQI